MSTAGVKLLTLRSTSEALNQCKLHYAKATAYLSKHKTISEVSGNKYEHENIRHLIETTKYNRFHFYLYEFKIMTF